MLKGQLPVACLSEDKLRCNGELFIFITKPIIKLFFLDHEVAEGYFWLPVIQSKISNGTVSPSIWRGKWEWKESGESHGGTWSGGCSGGNTDSAQNNNSILTGSLWTQAHWFIRSFSSSLLGPSKYEMLNIQWWAKQTPPFSVLHEDDIEAGGTGFKGISTLRGI